MWTSKVDLKLSRVLLARLIGLIYPNIYYSSLSPLYVANAPRSTLPAENWVRVRNRLAGICGSDLPLIHRDTDVRTSVAALPDSKLIYPGHEVVGEVIEIGQDVQHLHVGDRVVLQYSPNCLSSGAQPVCRACTAGNYNLCQYGPLPGPQPIGGGWSEEMLLHEQQLFRLPPELTDEQGVILEPTAVALHAVMRHLPQADDNVLIIGAGTIGLLTLHILHTLVPKAHISILARYPFQIEHATRLGADHIIYPMDPYASVQRATPSRLYKGKWGNQTLLGGYDVIYNTVGERNTLHHALRWLRTQGTMVLVGLSPHMMHIDLTPIWHQEINFLGSLSHGRETWPLEPRTDDLQGTSSSPSTFSVVTELIQQKRIQPEQLITHRFAITKYKDALIAAKHKKRSQSIKVLFDYALIPASTVPNVRASARPHRPALSQPQGDTFVEEILTAQDGAEPHHDPEQEAIPQLTIAPQTFPSKIMDTPPPQGLTEETWQSILNKQDEDDDYDDEETETALPAIKLPRYNPHTKSRIVESPQTPIPPAIELTPALTVETPKTKTGELETNPTSAQQTLEPQQAEVPSELPASTDHTPLELSAELPANEEELVSPFPQTLETNALTEEQLPMQTVEKESASPLPEAMNADASIEEQLPPQTFEDESISPLPETVDTDASTEEQLPPQTFEDELASPLLETVNADASTEEQLPPQTVEEEPISPLPETVDANVLTEEQLPTQTVLDNLFDTDTSLMPEFLAQLSDFGALTAHEIPVDKIEIPTLPESPADKAEDPVTTEIPNDNAEVSTLSDTDSPDQVKRDQIDAILAPSTSTEKKIRKASKSASTSKTINNKN